MKNTLQTVLTISNTDIVTMLVVKQKRRVNLKSSNSKTTKNRFIIKIRSYFRSKLKKDGMKIIQRCNTKRCKNSCFSL
jgi:hypothetical protein